MNPKKKLLILVDWFTPGFKAGGPIQSCVNLCSALNTQYEIYVLTTNTDHGEKLPYEGIEANQWIYNSRLNVMIYYMDKQLLSAAKLSEQINHINAGIVYLNHLFSPYFVLLPLWLKFRKKINARVVVCPRGALYDSALSLKSYKKKPLLRLYKWLGIRHLVSFHATNLREKTAIEKYFPGSKITVADNLPNMQQEPYSGCKKEAGQLSCIFIARIVPIKNLLFLLQVLSNVKEQVLLTIAGPVENEIYWQQCNSCIRQLPENITIQYIGAKKHDELSDLIQQHHLFVLPTTGENFGHSILEALLAGRPVLISDQTPWLNLQQQHAGWDIPLTSKNEFAKIITEMANSNQQQFDEHARAAWNFAHQFIHNTTAKKQYHMLFS